MSRFFEIIGMMTVAILLFIGVYYFTSKMSFDSVQPLFEEVKHPYEFYNDAYANLVASVIGLFTALVAVAIAVFGFQKWYDRKSYEEIKKEMEEFEEEQRKEIPQKIDKGFEEQEEKISKKIENLVLRYIKSEVEKAGSEVVCSTINAELSVFFKEEKFFFAKEHFKHIVSKMNLTFSDDETLNTFLLYHNIILQLLQIIDECYISVKDEDFINSLRILYAHLMFVKTKNELVFDVHGLSKIINCVNSILEKK